MRWIKKSHLSNFLKLIIFACGGLLGAILNWSITFTLTEYVHLYYVLSSVTGNVINSLFNFCYHRSVTFKVSSEAKSRLVKFIVLNVLIVSLNVSTMYLLTEIFHLWYMFSSVMATFFIVVLNFVLNQSIVFFEMAEVDYRTIKVDHYEKRERIRNPLRALILKNRNSRMRELVEKAGYSGAVIVELGCGSCAAHWNANHLPVLGIDLNRAVLVRAHGQSRIDQCIECSPDAVGLKSSSADVVVAADVLEHVSDYDTVLAEANRILKPGGRLIASVPDDRIISLWKPLFFGQCLLHWYVFGDDYYRNKCGHINSFSPVSLRRALRSKGFDIAEEYDAWRMTIYMSAVKNIPQETYSDVTVIIPTLNERENIGKLIDRMVELYRGISVIVADDGSKDGTQDLVLGKSRSNPRVLLIDRSTKPHGLTASVVDAICSVKTSRFVVIDADFQHPPEKVGDIVRLLDREDLVVGTRVKVEDWEYSRHFMSIVATSMGKLSLLVRRSATCSDIMSGFFGARTLLAMKYIEANPSAFAGSGYKVLFDLLKLMPRSTRVGEVPYTFANRSEGKSKISTKHIAVYFTSLFK